MERRNERIQRKTGRRISMNKLLITATFIILAAIMIIALIAGINLFIQVIKSKDVSLMMIGMAFFCLWAAVVLFMCQGFLLTK